MVFRKRYLGQTSAIAIAVAAAMPALAQGFDWSGVYVGGTLGQSTSSGSLTFGADTESGAFESDRAVSLAEGFDPEFATNVTNTVTGYMAGELVGAMSEGAGSETTQTLFGGMRWQAGLMTYGGEARHSFGGTDIISSAEWQETSHFVGSAGTLGGTTPNPGISTFFDDEINGFDPEGAVVFSPDPEFGNYDVTMTQDISMDFESSIGGMTSLVATVGRAVGRTHVFAMAGPAFAHVSATASATMTEAGVATTDYSAGSATDGFQTETYNFLELSEQAEWSGEASEDMVGYTIGAAVEMAVTDNILFRLEAEYFNLGTITVTGESSDEGVDDASLSQVLDGTRVGAGLVFKF